MRKLKLFNWHGVNRLQQKQKGTIVAESAMMAQQQLMSRGLQHIKLQQNWQLNSKPKNAEVCALLSQLATLLQAAVPLKNSLQILLQHCTNIALNAWLRQLLKDIERFHSLLAQKIGRFYNLLCLNHLNPCKYHHLFFS